MVAELDIRQHEMRRRMQQPALQEGPSRRYIFAIDRLRLFEDAEGLHFNVSSEADAAVLKPAQVRELMTALHRHLNPASTATVRFRVTCTYTVIEGKRKGEKSFWEFPRNARTHDPWETDLKKTIDYLERLQKAVSVPVTNWDDNKETVSNIKIYVSHRVSGKWQNEYKATKPTHEEFLQRFGQKDAR